MANSKRNAREGKDRRAGVVLWHKGRTVTAPWHLGAQTLAQQRRELRAYAALRGIPILEEFKQEVTDRTEVQPALQRLPRLLRACPVEVVFINRRVLWSIEGNDLIVLAVELQKLGIDLVLCD